MKFKLKEDERLVLFNNLTEVELLFVSYEAVLEYLIAFADSKLGNLAFYGFSYEGEMLFKKIRFFRNGFAELEYIEDFFNAFESYYYFDEEGYEQKLFNIHFSYIKLC